MEYNQDLDDALSELVGLRIAAKRLYREFDLFSAVYPGAASHLEQLKSQINTTLVHIEADLIEYFGEQ